MKFVQFAQNQFDNSNSIFSEEKCQKFTFSSSFLFPLRHKTIKISKNERGPLFWIPHLVPEGIAERVSVVNVPSASGEDMLNFLYFLCVLWCRVRFSIPYYSIPFYSLSQSFLCGSSLVVPFSRCLEVIRKYPRREKRDIWVKDDR